MSLPLNPVTLGFHTSLEPLPPYRAEFTKREQWNDVGERLCFWSQVLEICAENWAADAAVDEDFEEIFMKSFLQEFGHTLDWWGMSGNSDTRISPMCVNIRCIEAFLSAFLDASIEVSEDRELNFPVLRRGWDSLTSAAGRIEAADVSKLYENVYEPVVAKYTDIVSLLHDIESSYFNYQADP
jgi:hypothetical protein